LALLTVTVVLGVGYERVRLDQEARGQLRHQYAMALQRAVTDLYGDITTIGLLMGKASRDGQSVDAAVLSNFMVQKREALSPLHYLARLRDPEPGSPDIVPEILLWSSRLTSFDLMAIPEVVRPAAPRAPHMFGAGVIEDAADEFDMGNDGDDEVVVIVPVPLSAVQTGAPTRMVGVVDVGRLLAGAFSSQLPLSDRIQLDVNGQAFGHWTGPGKIVIADRPDDQIRINSGQDVIQVDFMARPMSFRTAVVSWHSLGVILVFGGLAAYLWAMGLRTAAVEIERPSQQPPRHPDGRDDALGQLRLLGELSQSLSHDLAQPVNIIRLAAEGALDRLSSAPPDKERLSVTLSNIVDQALSLQQKMNAVVSCSRPPASAPSAFMPAGVVRSALSAIMPRLRDENIKLQWHADLGAPWVVGHAERLEQAILNLLTNACDSISAAHLSRKAKTAGPAGWLKVKCFGVDPGDVHIVIEDDGLGMPEAIQRRLTEPFPPPSGSLRGIGLPISLGIVAEMDGTLTSPRVPVGARIEIRLPGVAPLLLRKDAAAGRHVMIVDDEKGAVDEMESFLSAHGWTVSSAYGGNQAWSMFLTNPVDAVITDLHMSNGDGLSLIASLHQYAPDMPIMAITTARDEESHRAVQAGVALVLTKPVSLADIEAELDGLL
jgi:signal transduction histidine kinase/CheY-like chemotaxis protein